MHMYCIVEDKYPCLDSQSKEGLANQCKLKGHHRMFCLKTVPSPDQNHLWKLVPLHAPNSSWKVYPPIWVSEVTVRCPCLTLYGDHKGKIYKLVYLSWCLTFCKYPCRAHACRVVMLTGKYDSHLFISGRTWPCRYHRQIPQKIATECLLSCNLSLMLAKRSCTGS